MAPFGALGLLIEERRTALGLTRRQVAEACHVRVGTVNIWVRGVSPRRGYPHRETFPRHDTAMALARVLQIEPADVFSLIAPRKRVSPKRPRSQPGNICMCGCGGKTRPVRANDARDGRLVGQYDLWLPGHQCSLARLTRPLYVVDPLSGCWPAQRGLTLRRSQRGSRYYSQVSGTMAHRVIYERDIGPIPAGMVLRKALDYCTDTTCLNPMHWELVRNGSWRSPWGPAA